MDKRNVYMRPCVARHWDTKSKEFRAFEGFFHCWGQAYEEFETGPGNYTTAIVEDMDGQCYECWPDVKFTDVGRKGDNT